MNDIKSRLLDFAIYLNCSLRELERNCGLKRGVFSSKSESIGSDKLSNIIDTYPKLDIYWLITGQGNMIKETETSVIDNNYQSLSLTEIIGYLKEKDKRIELLIEERTEYKVKYDITKKILARQESDAGCAAATG